MGKTFYVLIAAVMILTACQQKPKAVIADQEAVKAAVSVTLDKFHSAMKAKDAVQMMAMFAENGLFCGTDSKEFYDKPALSGEMTRMFADTTLKINYPVNKREIRSAPDGNSAIAVDQIFINFICPKIPVRAVFHLAKTGENWLIDFYSLSLIPDNADLGKLNKAME